MQRDNPKPPFIVTHKRKKDGLEAMLLCVVDKLALYRVRFREAGKSHDNYVAASETHFNRSFA